MSSFDSDIEHLAFKYSGQLPRYTSYPTAVEFQESYSAECWEEALLRLGQEPSSSGSFYFHLPFCHSLCYFCACNKIIPRDRSQVRPYLEGLKKELTLYRDLINRDLPIEQVHLGGGTPNFLTPDELEELFLSFSECFPRLQTNADVSIEIDPRTVTRKHFDVLSRLGFNRVSFGVQDFSLEVQEAVNRIQPFQQTDEVCEMSREVGISNINIDLIYGLPLQTVASFSKTIDLLLRLQPTRIAVYGYAHVTWIRKVQRALERSWLPSPTERVGLFACALQRLTEAGYEYIGMDHFALPCDALSQARTEGRLNRNFMGYTTHRGANVLGLGASSISSTSSCFAQNARELELYLAQVNSGSIPTSRGLKRSGDDLIRGEVIEQLLTQGVISFIAIEEKWKVRFDRYFAAELVELQIFQADDLIRMEAGVIELTPTGRLFARNIAAVFDAYLKPRMGQEQPAFSQAV